MPNVTIKDGVGANLSLSAGADAEGNLVPRNEQVVAGQPVGDGNPFPVRARPSGSLTQTVVTLPAGQSTQLVGASVGRRYLAIFCTGTERVHLGFGAPAVSGQGLPLEPAAEAGAQGGGFVWDAALVPSGAVNAISAAGSTVVVLEG